MAPYRIFLGYRCDTQGEVFCSRLYSSILETPYYPDLYGEPYFSPETEETANYLNFEFLREIRYFIIPYTPGFFEYSTDNRPVIFQEIEKALEYNANITFIPVIFPGFNVKDISAEHFVPLLSPKVHSRLPQLIGAKFVQTIIADGADRHTQEQRIIRFLLSQMLCTNPQHRPNVYLTTKEQVELTPLFYRLEGVKKLTLLNYAGSSFITGPKTSSAYKDAVQKSFYQKLYDRKIQVEIILTEPGSAADRDACRYKMNGGEPIRSELVRGRIPRWWNQWQTKALVSHIIPCNLNDIMKLCREHPDIPASIYTSDIALPYSIMKCEYEDTAKNCMQICMYTPLIQDRDRPAFVLYQQDPETRTVYKVLEDSLRSIMLCATRQLPFRGIDFLTDRSRPIIHCAHLNTELIPMTRQAFAACAERELPVHCELLFLQDTIAVWQDGALPASCRPHGKDHFSQLTLQELEQFRHQEGNPFILTLKELLDLLEETAKTKGGTPVPLLVEIRGSCSPAVQIPDQIRWRVISACQLLNTYCGEFALVSTSAQVLTAAKDYDMRIPCGQITPGLFSEDPQVFREDQQVHSEARCTETLVPDFTACRIGDFGNNPESSFDKIYDSYKLPRLGWVSKTPAESGDIWSLYDNLVIEYDPFS